MSLKFPIINSILAYISASIFATIIHEAGHFLAALALKLDTTLYHNYVETNYGENNINHILVPAAGPMISLVLGIVCLSFFKKVTNPFISLLTFWMGIKGTIGFLGYMMIAPFSTAGDTGKILSLLEMSMIWQIIISIVFLILAIMFLLKLHLGYEFFISENIEATDKNTKGKWAQALIMYPIFIGIIVTTLLQFPIPHIISILPTLMLPFMLFMTYGKLVTTKIAIVKDESKNINDVSYWLILLCLIAVILNRMLVFGLSV